MIKKFNEFISEGVWNNPTVNRKVSNVKNDWDKDNYHFNVLGYDDYYISIDDNRATRGVYVYHYPEELEICKYIDIDFDESGKFIVEVRSSDDIQYDFEISDEDQELVESSEFISAVNETVQNLPNVYTFN